MNFTNISSPDQEKQLRFTNLQAQLIQRYQEVEHFDYSDQDILVVPSLSLDQREAKKIEGVHYFEERLLFYLTHLRNPRARLIYLTSQPLPPSVINYYLHLLLGISSPNDCDRLLLLSTDDPSHKPLTQKILERPHLIEQIRQGLRSERSYMICYNSTSLEKDLSVLVNVPLFALNPDLGGWGTKSGSRQIFDECGIPHPEGSKLVWNAEDLSLAAADLWERQPTAQRMVIKLNEGFSGQGNALLDLRSISSVAPGSASCAERAAVIYQNFNNMRFQAKKETWKNFSDRLTDMGAIVEVFIEGETKYSPSVQGCIMPTGTVELLSTHEQIMGGLDGQVFVGCSFPADPIFSLRLQELGLRIGMNLAEKGVLEDFCIDFLAVRQHDENKTFQWDIQAMEINLRKGGTTHPFRLLKSLTNGQYDFSRGIFSSQQGSPKYYVAFDKLQKDEYRGLCPSELMNIIADNHLHFDESTETGCVFHLMSCLSEVGRLGFTIIGNSSQEAEETYTKVIKVLDEYAGSRSPAV